MNATNRSYNGTRHAEFIAINEVLTTFIPTSSLYLGEKSSSEGKANEKEEGDEKKSQKEVKKRKYDPSVLKECDLYVTVEPCIMCASLLRQFGIRKVFFGASNEKFGGTGGVLDVQRGNGRTFSDEGERIGEGGIGEEGDYEVSGGWLREEAILLLRRFYVQENERAPEPRGKEGRVLKLVVEPLDGGEGKEG